MSSTATSSTTHNLAAFETIAQAYFGALADGNLQCVPWAEDVVLRAPLATHPLTGRREVEEYLRPLAGNLGEVRIHEIFLSSSRNAMTVEAMVGPLHVLDKFVIRDGQIVEQQNFYDPRPVLEAPSPGGLTAQERALLIEKLEASRELVREVLSGISPDSLNRRPADEGWTPLECAEHLVLTEEALLGLICRDIMGGAANPALPLDLQGRDAVVVAAMSDRSHKAKTFDFLEPRGAYTSATSALDAFLARRAATLEYVRATKDPVHHHAAPLEGLGLLDAYHWLLLIAGHTERHVAQIREALR